MWKRTSRIGVIAVLVASAVGCDHEKGAEISVGAATSLREVMPELVRSFESTQASAHKSVRVSATYAASGELKAQVLAGAPLDAVFFAAARPVDELVAQGRITGASRQVVASNELVLVGRKGSPGVTFESLASLPRDQKLAVGDPRTVPAGEYAYDYLAELGEWDALKDRLVTGSNVAAVMVYVRREEAAVGIVYRTELRAAPELVVLDVAHGPRAPRPSVVAGVVSGGRSEAAEFVRFVASPDGQKVLLEFGFGTP